MRTTILAGRFLIGLASFIILLMPRATYAQASGYRGLWVGSASLSAVNEVSIPLDENNVPVAPKPLVPTPTSDRADIRIIIHVNGAGQASLLKDVAILNREDVSTNSLLISGQAVESDIALVTDPRLYSVFPPQPAVRIASATFDFGDIDATYALDELVNTAAVLAARFATNSSLSLGTNADRVLARNAATAQITPVLDTRADNADVAKAFSDFLLVFNASAVNLIAANPADPIVASLTTNATAIRDRSFYRDPRPLDMVNAVVAAVNATTTNRQAVAHKTASSYADVLNLYQRFISGKVFGEMITAAALQAGTSALATGATQASVLTAIRSTPESVTAIAGALSAKVNAYNDTRSSDAVDAVLAGMASAAFAMTNATATEIASAADAAGRDVLSDMVRRYPLPPRTPGVDYNAFVQSPGFDGAADIIAAAAARAAIEERANNPLYTFTSLENAARLAAIDAANSLYAEAARAMRTEIPMTGSFAPGSGDARFVAELSQPTDLGPAGLSATVVLPANHPTNPFRHRRHPDHRTGFDITRKVRLDFDSMGTNSLALSYGVNKITGLYREEVFGLHKPLGPQPNTSPIGLKTEGRFELNRISLIDTLNNF